MQSNYKKLGQYIKEVKLKNKNLEVTNLRGVSITKKFIPSIANIIGADMSTYKIVKNNQFAYGPVTSRNGEKISVALFVEDEAIVSQAYTVFEIIDHEELLPEYLMMWFRRPEFDRYARYMSHGSVREIFGWDEMCDIDLPVPSPDKQREIVKEYNVIVNRIKLNEQLNQKLEETAQAIYKQWFVDFEFPISAEYAALIGKPELEGKPYKSSGGEMVYCDELEKDIPRNWKVDKIKNFCKDMKSGGTPNRGVPKYWESRDVPWLKTSEVANGIIIEAEEYISHDGYKNSSTKLIPVNSVLMAMYGDGKTKGQVGLLKFQASTNQACCAMICNTFEESAYLYYHLRCNQKKIKSFAIGGAQENLSKALIEELSILVTGYSLDKKAPFGALIENREMLTKETLHLKKMATIILSGVASNDIMEIAA